MEFDGQELLEAALDIGENMLRCGAEVSRVEDSIYRICTSYGATRVDVFTITSSMVVTAHFGTCSSVTQTRRIRTYATNFDRLDQLNTLSRRICKTHPDLHEIRWEIENILEQQPPPFWRQCIGPILDAGGFCLFFGGHLRDALVVALLSVLVVAVEDRSKVRRLNQIAYYFFISFVCGMLSIAFVRIGLGMLADKIMIGIIMLLIPGVGLTNAIRDLLSGDMIAGLLRLTEALLLAFSIACGFAVTIVLFGKGVVIL